MKEINMSCTRCGNKFTLSHTDLEFIERIKDPVPNICFECRAAQRLAFWPFGKFSKRVCDKTGEPLISIFSSRARFPVFSNAAWNAEDWDLPFLEYDSSKSFFDQLFELQSKVPKAAQFGAQNINSDYCDDVWESKDCCLCRSILACENLSYSYRNVRCRDSRDLFYCYDMEQSYDCTFCLKCFNVQYSIDVRDSFDSAFLYDCRNVRNCFFSWNLRNKEYYIYNKPYSKEEYEQEIKKFKTGSRTEFKKLQKDFLQRIANEAIHKQSHNTKIINASGDYLSECKNCNDCFFFDNSENCARITRGISNKDSMDACGLWKSELAYDVNQGDGYQIKHSSYFINCRESEYLDSCTNCSFCFGCVGLRNKSYCILNKQYSENEYAARLSQIKEDMQKRGEYGEFLPYKMAYVGYNLSIADLLFPKSQAEVESLGGFFEDMDLPSTEGIKESTDADDISEVNDFGDQCILICKKTGRPFSFTPSDIYFFKTHKIALPELYHDVRAMERIQQIFSLKENHTQCVFCKKDIVAYYNEKLGYKKIACEDCYQREIV